MRLILFVLFHYESQSLVLLVRCLFSSFRLFSTSYMYAFQELHLCLSCYYFYQNYVHKLKIIIIIIIERE